MMRAVYTKAIASGPALEQLHQMADKDLSRGRTPRYSGSKTPDSHGALTAEVAVAT
jgi:hypothetical protein